MPFTIGCNSGGFSTPWVKFDVVIPEAIATGLNIAGSAQFLSSTVGNGSLVTFAGNFTAITPSGTTNQYLTVLLNYVTGAITAPITTGAPTAPGTNQIVLATQNVPASVAANTIPVLQGGWTVNNQW